MLPGWIRLRRCRGGAPVRFSASSGLSLQVSYFTKGLSHVSGGCANPMQEHDMHMQQLRDVRFSAQNRPRRHKPLAHGVRFHAAGIGVQTPSWRDATFYPATVRFGFDGGRMHPRLFSRATCAPSEVDTRRRGPATSTGGKNQGQQKAEAIIHWSSTL